MRNYFALCALALTVMLSSCGSNKNAAFDGNRSVANPPAITKALEKSATRAYGTATQFDLGFATRTATAAARQELASAIMQIITSNNAIDNLAYSLYATDGKKSGTAKDEESKTQEMVEAIVAEIPVSGAVIIENNIYKTKDGQYQVFVCVEYQGKALELADKMADGLRKYLEQTVSEEKRSEINKEVKDFRENTLQRIREMNGE